MKEESCWNIAAFGASDFYNAVRLFCYQECLENTGRTGHQSSKRINLIYKHSINFSAF